MNMETFNPAMERHGVRPITRKQVVACQHVVPQPGLTRDEMGDESYEIAIRERRVWLQENRKGAHVGELVRDCHGKVTGRAFRFSDEDEAFHFKLRFG